MKKLVMLVLVLFSIQFYFGCSDEISSPTNDSIIEVDFPIGKKAIYAVGQYEENVAGDSVFAQFLNIFSIQFDSVSTSNNNIEYLGKIEQYCLLPDGSGKLIHDPAQCTSSGNVHVTINDNWVLYQQSEVDGAYHIFMKNDAAITDTMPVPTLLEMQFPVYPKHMTPNTMYSAYRPGSPDAFGAVQRDFSVKDFSNWSDVYGTSRGIYCNTEHILIFNNGSVLDFVGIIDPEGIVISRFTIRDVVRTFDNPAGSDSISMHTVNRRIVDFSNPEEIKDLSWYANLVIENGLELLE